MSEGYVLRYAQMGDLRALVDLAANCVEAPQWSEQVWTDCLQEKRDCAVLVGEQSGSVKGFVAVSIVAGVAELESLAVVQKARRQGLAHRLCCEAIARAQKLGATAMELEVRESNVAARALYATMGFVEQGRRRGYYRDPDEDALLMTLALAQER